MNVKINTVTTYTLHVRIVKVLATHLLVRRLQGIKLLR